MDWRERIKQWKLFSPFLYFPNLITSQHLLPLFFLTQQNPFGAEWQLNALQAQQMVFCFGIGNALNLNQIITAAYRNKGNCILRSLAKILHWSLAHWFISFERWQTILSRRIPVLYWTATECQKKKRKSPVQMHLGFLQPRHDWVLNAALPGWSLFKCSLAELEPILKSWAVVLPVAWKPPPSLRRFQPNHSHRQPLFHIQNVIPGFWFVFLFACFCLVFKMKRHKV